MRFGYNTNGFAHHRLEDTFVILWELGYQSVAVTLDHGALNPFDADLSRQLAAACRLVQHLGLHTVVETGARFLLDPRRKHQPTLLSPDPLQRERRLDFLRRAVDIAGALGSEAVSFWSGTPEDKATPAILWQRLTDGCLALCDYAARKKMRLAFEPEPGMFVDTMALFSQLQGRANHPNLGLTIDVGHLHCQGEIPIAEQLAQWSSLLWNVHVEDMRRGIHEHLPFGEGEIDFAPVLRALRKMGYGGGVHVELSRHSHNAVNTARDSLAFLRRFG
jgi:sugar phosphate isomerase/epimerase